MVTKFHEPPSRDTWDGGVGSLWQVTKEALGRNEPLNKGLLMRTPLNCLRESFLPIWKCLPGPLPTVGVSGHRSNERYQELVFGPHFGGRGVEVKYRALRVHSSLQRILGCC